MIFSGNLFEISTDLQPKNITFLHNREAGKVSSFITRIGCNKTDRGPMNEETGLL